MAAQDTLPCFEHFDVFKTGIELILDEKLERASKAKKMSATQKAIEKIKSKLGAKEETEAVE